MAPKGMIVMTDLKDVTLDDLTAEDPAFSKAVDSMLTNLQLLDRTGAVGGAVTSPSQGVAVIEAGMTAGAKWWAGIVAGLGGSGVVVATLSDVWTDAGSAVQVAAVLGLAGLLAACALAVAWILAADLRARGTGAAAVYAARAEVTCTLLRIAEHELRPGTSGGLGVNLLNITETLPEPRASQAGR
jgi:hypothetical protein